MTIDASLLTIEEKARILYRHAKSATLSDNLKSIIRHNAAAVVQHAHFTPERVRRLIQQGLGELSVCATLDDIKKGVAAIIQDATDGMRKSFNKLERRHKTVLLAMVNQDYSLSDADLLVRSRAMDSNTTAVQFAEAFDDLAGTFIRIRENSSTSNSTGGSCAWIHPSYRDLVIDEVTRDVELQQRFLAGATSHGIELVLAGDQRDGCPIIASLVAWEPLKEAMLRAAASGSRYDVCRVLGALSNAAGMERTDADLRARLSECSRGTLEQVLSRWESHELEMRADDVRLYRDSVIALSLDLRLPSMRNQWEMLNAQLILKWVDGVDAQQLQEWCRLLELVRTELLDADAFELVMKNASAAAKLFIEGLVSEIGAGTPDFGRNRRSEILEGIAQEFDAVADVLPELIVAATASSSELEALVGDCSGHAERLREAAHTTNEPEYDYDGDPASTSDYFSVEALFEDL